MVFMLAYNGHVVLIVVQGLVKTWWCCWISHALACSLWFEDNNYRMMGWVSCLPCTVVQAVYSQQLVGWGSHSSWHCPICCGWYMLLGLSCNLKWLSLSSMALRTHHPTYQPEPAGLIFCIVMSAGAVYNPCRQSAGLLFSSVAACEFRLISAMAKFGWTVKQVLFLCWSTLL